MRLKLVLTALLLAVTAVFVLAQSRDINEVIPACNWVEAEMMIRMLDRTGFGTDYAALLNHAAEDESLDEINMLIMESIELRKLFQDKVLPNVPDCAAAQNVARSLGAIVDDLTITFSTLKIGIDDGSLKDIQAYGISRVKVIGEESTAALDDIKQLAALAKEPE